MFPVDPVALNIPDYPRIITEPMDISTVEKKVKEYTYTSYTEFETDVRKIWQNALKYNPMNSQIYDMTLEIQKYFEKLNQEESEMEKFNKMKSRMLDNEKKIDRTQNKAGGQRGSKVNNYKLPNIEHPLTYQEKKNLSTMIRSLETEHLLGVWEIVSEGNDQIKDNEIEFDIETLPVRKARELEKYVQSKLELMKKTKKKVKTETAPPMQPYVAPTPAPVPVNADNGYPNPVTAPESNAPPTQVQGQNANPVAGKKIYFLFFMLSLLCKIYLTRGVCNFFKKFIKIFIIL
jgi:hypothetical protein